MDDVLQQQQKQQLYTYRNLETQIGLNSITSNPSVPINRILLTMPSTGGPISKTGSFTLTRWVTLAIASGAFAALNGLFAKLFVHLTTSFSS